jgi:hypothetical protein
MSKRQHLRFGVTQVGEKPAYAMPCPKCRTLMDARLKLCPHCGADTDQKLMPLRLVFPLVAVALVLGVGALLQRCVAG